LDSVAPAKFKTTSKNTNEIDGRFTWNIPSDYLFPWSIPINFIATSYKDSMVNTQSLTAHLKVPPIISTGNTPAFSENKDVKIYPNPFSSKATLKIPQKLAKDPLELKVFSTQGKQVMQKSIHKQQTRLYFKGQSSGIYWYKLVNPSTNERMDAGRFIFQPD